MIRHEFSCHQKPEKMGVEPADAISSIGNKMTYCPVCSGPITPFKKGIYDTRFGVAGQFEFNHCSCCDIAIMGHMPARANLKELYETYYNHGNLGRKKRYERLKMWFLKSVLYKIWMKTDGDICFHSKIGQGKLLDVGTNEGTGLILFQNNGYEVEGLEMSSLAAQSAQDKGFIVNLSDIETYDTEKKFDIIVLSNILEHSNRPLEVLKQARRFLKPSGEAWLSTPNLHSLFRRLFGRYWINWHVPFHASIFSEKALTEILTKSGFKVKTLTHRSPSLWNAQSIISFLFSKEGKATTQHRNPLLISALMFALRLFCFPILMFINLAGRGDCIIITARRI